MPFVCDTTSILVASPSSTFSWHQYHLGFLATHLETELGHQEVMDHDRPLFLYPETTIRKHWANGSSRPKGGPPSISNIYISERIILR